MTDLYKMKLHEILYLTTHGDIMHVVHRVPGGWNYIYYDRDRQPSTSVFVPMNSEFNRRAETA